MLGSCLGIKEVWWREPLRVEGGDTPTSGLSLTGTRVSLNRHQRPEDTGAVRLSLL